MLINYTCIGNDIVTELYELDTSPSQISLESFNNYLEILNRVQSLLGDKYEAMIWSYQRKEITLYCIGNETGKL